jgi:hypothetical protein
VKADTGVLVLSGATRSRQLSALVSQAAAVLVDEPSQLDRMGLIWLLKSEHVVALTATEAKLSGGLTFIGRVRIVCGLESEL